MRKSFEGLSGLVTEYFRQELLTGHLFLFLNRRRDRIKIVHFDSDGLVIWYKRMDRGSIRFRVGKARQREWTTAELAAVLSGIDLSS
jgi:transposase